MAKKVFTDESLATFVDEIKSYTDNAVYTKANTSHTHSISNITNLQSALDSKAESSHTHIASEITDVDWMATKELAGGSTVIPEQTISSGSWKNLQESLQAGLIYDVVFNGEVYSCEATNYDGGIILGNNPSMSLNDYPFCISWAGGSAIGGILFKSSNISYPVTLKVILQGHYMYNQMPEEYLPDSLHTQLDNLQSTLDAKSNTGHTHSIDNVTNLQTTLDGKQATITGGASTITSSNLTASRALVSDSSGKVAVSAVTSTELGYLDGVTSAIQTQLDAKVPTSRTINSKALTANITLSASDVGAYTKAEIDALELITTDDIDAICGTTIQLASEVTF